ncbi:unnamed protein product [Phytophthora lilii]|uniref:Unnamed protein product n=1 Tax=Phytophthora lilii TaxID=2077276 RepID=A0A9W6WNL5_9STRA|nr:unnamed protein product [Phytophthora lilii]
MRVFGGPVDAVPPSTRLQTGDPVVAVPAAGVRRCGGELFGGVRLQVHVDLECHAAGLLYHPSGDAAVDCVPESQTMQKASWDVSALYGDFLCLFGSAVYACSNVGQEYLVKKENRRVSSLLDCGVAMRVDLMVFVLQMEFLGLVGFFGFLISSAQAVYFEGDVVRAVDWYDGVSCSSRSRGDVFGGA